jgi:hypothetical protein
MTRKYGPKASEKIGQTMHEWKRGTLKSGGSGKKVTSRKQAIAIGLSQARAKGYKVPPSPTQGHAAMSIDARVRAYLSNMKPGTEIDGWGLARELKVDPYGAGYALERAVRDGHAVTEDGRWFGPAQRGSAHARRKKYPYIAYWIRSRGPGSARDSVPIYVLGTTSRADEGIVGHDLRIRPLRLGKGVYTSVVSPDDVEDKP